MARKVAPGGAAGESRLVFSREVNEWLVGAGARVDRNGVFMVTLGVYIMVDFDFRAGCFGERMLKYCLFMMI